ncbi:MAG TPA: tetratricopeptide repeat protein [Hyphomicrobiales bacterium]|nr:tetratricopeptide repeat protein [Hyphomicrobiales bacterium]
MAKRRRAAPNSWIAATVATLEIWQRRIRSRSFWIRLITTGPRVAWRFLKSALKGFYTLIVRIPWVLAVFVIGVIIIQGLVKHATVIKPIFVPKTLAENGFTAEVAGQRLRDAMLSFISDLPTHKKSPEVALYGDLPNVIVPTVGISLDAVVSSIRTLARSTRSRTISGEVTIKQDRLWLVLRIDGEKIYESKEGVEPNQFDGLFVAAVPDVLKVISPYFAALSLSYKNPDGALDMASELLSQLPAGDENIAWLFNLRGKVYLEKGNYVAATDALKAAVRVKNDLIVAHVNLGTAYAAQKLYEKASVEYDKAIILDKDYAPVHYNRGILHVQLNKPEIAIAEFRKAIKLDAKDIESRNGLARLLKDKHLKKEAKEQYEAVIEIDSRNQEALNGLAELGNE